MNDHIQFFDDLTWKRVLNLSADMGITPRDVVRRAIEVLVQARKVAKGNEIDRRNQGEEERMQ